MQNAPIFIIGAPRSGTTLLAAMLAAHSRLSCGPETHFFRRLVNQDQARLCDPLQWPTPAVEFICSITHTSYNDTTRKPLLEKYQLSREQIVEHLTHQPPSIAAILMAVTAQYAVVQGKMRWVEKTPDHTEYLASIRQHFPVSPIIRIIRDPRDAALSLTRVPWGAASFTEALFLWKRYEEISSAFFADDAQCYTLRYEDLVLSSEDTLSKLCQFIGEPFEASMLDTSSTGKQVNSRNVPWKDKVSQPVDTSRAAAWKALLPEDDNLLSEALLGKQLVKYGYQQVVGLHRFGEVHPVSYLSEKYAEGLKKVAASGVRLWKVYANEKPGVKVYLGDPGDTGWLDNVRPGKVGSLTAALKDFATSLMSKKIYWIPDPNARAWSGLSAFFVKTILAPFKIAE